MNNLQHKLKTSIMASSASTSTEDNVGLVPCSNDEPIRSADTDDVENPNHVSYLGDETLCIPNELFFKLLQDPGEPHVDTDARVKYKKTTQRPL